MTQLAIDDFLDENGQWVCIQCGACCLVGPAAFPEHPLLSKWNRGDGGCKKLTNSLRCSIYECRPDICNTRVNSPDATEVERAMACAALRDAIDEQVARGDRSSKGRKWMLGRYTLDGKDLTP